MTQGKKVSREKIKKIRKFHRDYSVRHVAQLLELNPKTVKKYIKKK